MPGNTITINNSKKLEWYVGDSKMDKLIEYLDDVGIREQDKGENNALSTQKKK